MILKKVIQATYVVDYKIELKFNDGKVKIIDFESLLWGEVFEPLKSKDFFRNFKLNPFTIEWENGADFAPEFLYDFGDVREEEVS